MSENALTDRRTQPQYFKQTSEHKGFLVLSLKALRLHGDDYSQVSPQIFIRLRKRELKSLTLRKKGSYKESFRPYLILKTIDYFCRLPSY
ncbi:CLUMA_CG014132, isoform A [Clunio marinus]|uniref:CLUMA_CG014132, isoform A n=1 Tax=Clunio marinus TaxID=568069 RepID=A0A1J1IQX0_9DIPT|nr:CLUMA_CG014132, isoform A [Clunio marinus]